MRLKALLVSLLLFLFCDEVKGVACFIPLSHTTHTHACFFVSSTSKTRDISIEIHNTFQ